MRELSLLDKIGVWALIAASALSVGLTIVQAVLGGVSTGTFSLGHPESPEAYPPILAVEGIDFIPPERAPRAGDRLVGHGSADVRGRRPLEVYAAWRAEGSRQREAGRTGFSITYSREGVRCTRLRICRCWRRWPTRFPLA